MRYVKTVLDAAAVEVWGHHWNPGAARLTVGAALVVAADVWAWLTGGAP